MIINYSNKNLITNKNSGIYLSKELAALEPNIDFGNLLTKQNYYTLIMYDPDAPNNNHNFIHWVITNIQLTNSGKKLLKYKGPNPPSNSGIHRYIFSLFIQSTYNELTNITDRDISISDLLDQLDLKKSNIIDHISFTSSFTNEKGGKIKIKRKLKSRKLKKKRRRKSCKF